jgi:hypothetical protein
MPGGCASAATGASFCGAAETLSAFVPVHVPVIPVKTSSLAHNLTPPPDILPYAHNYYKSKKQSGQEFLNCEPALKIVVSRRSSVVGLLVGIR